MKFSILSSSSSGNCSFIQLGKNKYLIDAGLSGKKCTEKLNNIGERIEDIKGIFVTHEHTDHILGLGVLSRKYNIPIYLHEITYNVIKDKIGKIDKKNLKFLHEKSIIIEDSIINNFEVMHDAQICLGFSFMREEKKLSYVSDMGHVTNIIKENIKKSDVLVVESNYDYNMLMNGSYSWDLKNRVKGRHGHLSNSEASKLVAEVMCDKLKKIYLMHISKDNNTPELAYNSMIEILRRFKKESLELEIATDKETLLYNI